jgi:hypothetical protein
VIVSETDGSKATDTNNIVPHGIPDSLTNGAKPISTILKKKRNVQEEDIWQNC